MIKVILKVIVFVVVASGFCIASPTPPGTNRNSDGLMGQRSCNDGLYLSSSNLCCLNCPAGEHQISPCTRDEGKSVCSECAIGTFTEHSNHLPSCLSCIKCRSDQEEVQPCSPTQNTVCRCRPGRFCTHDQACEVCHRCRRCKDGETTVKNCTADSDRECAKSPTTSPQMAFLLILPVLIAPLIAAGYLVYKRKRHWLTCLHSPSPDNSKEDAAHHGSLEITQNAQNLSVQIPLLPSEEPRPGGSVTEEDLGLGSSSSETSLSAQHPNLCTSMPPSRACPMVPSRSRPGTPSRPYARNDDSLLVPLKGDESLKSCFEYFYELDHKVHKRFFRSLDLSDNAITYADRNNPQDAVHELLVTWLEKQGREACLTHLLRKLRDLEQNLMAEDIIEKAISDGHYERAVNMQLATHLINSD